MIQMLPHRVSFQSHHLGRGQSGGEDQPEATGAGFRTALPGLLDEHRSEQMRRQDADLVAARRQYSPL